MLEAVAMCVVLFDFHGIWISYLPEKMQNELHEEIGFDPWGDAIQDELRTALGSASESDSQAALAAMLAAQRRYHRMTVEDVTTGIQDCAQRFAYVEEEEG